MTHHPRAKARRRVSFQTAAIAALFLALGTLPQVALGQTKTAPSMKIGIIGSGNIGGTVGTLWVKAGHQVLFSSRNPENLKQLVDGLGPLARAGTVREALAFGDAFDLDGHGIDCLLDAFESMVGGRRVREL